MRYLLGLLALSVLVGCGSTNAAQEEAFLESVRLEAGYWLAEGEDIDEETALFFGYLVCRELEEGRLLPHTAATWAMEAYPNTPEAVDAATAATALCPDWSR